MTHWLRAERSFALLWLGQAVSYLGTQVSLLAIPLLAVEVLGVSPFEMGAIVALTRLPYLVIGLGVGVMVDRVPRRATVLVANVGLGATLLVLPVADHTGRLSLTVLYLVAVTMGTWAVVFDIAYLAFVPEVVARRHLTETQSLVEITQSLGQLGGPLIAGWLVAATSAPTAIGLDAATYAVAAATVALIPGGRAIARTGSGLRSDVGEGLRAVLGQPMLRAVTLANATYLFWLGAYLALLVIHLGDGLGATPQRIGVVFAIGSVGGVAGAVAAKPIGDRLGARPTLAAALVGAGLAAGLLPAAGAVAGTIGVSLALAVSQLAQQVFNVHQVPFRYLLTPDRLHGRVNAVIRTIAWGSAPGGALTAGALGSLLGVPTALALSGLGAMTAALWILTGASSR